MTWPSLNRRPPEATLVRYSSPNRPNCDPEILRSTVNTHTRKAPGTALVVTTSYRQIHLTAEELSRLPQHTVVVSYRTPSGTRTRTYTGPLLRDVLHHTKPALALQDREDTLHRAVTAIGSDDYHITLAWDEIEPASVRKAVLIALVEDGRPIPCDRLRLAVTDDVCGTRQVDGLVRVHLTACED